MTLQNWNPEVFATGLTNPAKVAKILQQAAIHIDAALANGDFETLKTAFFEHLQCTDPYVVGQLIMRDTLSSVELSAYRAPLEGPLLELHKKWDELYAAFSIALQKQTPDNLILADFREYKKKLAPFDLDPKARPWHTLASSTGFGVLGSIHDTVLKNENIGSVAVGGIEVAITQVNIDTLARHSDAYVRRQSTIRVGEHMLKLSPILEATKRARARFIIEDAKLRGYPNLFEATLTRAQLSYKTIEALKSQKPRIRSVVSKYFSWIKEKLNYSEFYDTDRHAKLPEEENSKTSLTSLINVLTSWSAQLCPAYPNIVNELFEKGGILTDPNLAKSGGFYMCSNLSGGTPLVHAPFHNDQFSFEVAAHEIGHACHITHAVRSQGPIAGSHYAVSFVEIFSTLFEIAARNEVLQLQQDPVQKKIWGKAIVEQFFHYVVHLFANAEFDEFYFQNIDAPIEILSKKYVETYFDFYPDFVKPAFSGENRIWLRNSLQEDMPHYGYGYVIAFLVASHIYLNPEKIISYEKFANECAYLPLAAATQKHLNFDIEDPSCFEFLWDHIEKIMAALEVD